SFIINYEEVDIKKVSQDIAKFTNKTLIMDPRVNGKVTIYSDNQLSQREVWNVYLRTIQVNGFAAVIDGNIVRIVPENESIRDLNAAEDRAATVTRIIAIKNRAAGEIVPMIKPITGRQSHISYIASINSLLLVDTKSNIERIEELIASVDKENSAAISIIPLLNLSAAEAVRILEKLKLQNNPTINEFIAVPFLPSNSVIVSANQFVTENIRNTLNDLDGDAKNNSTLGVIYLKYAKAEEISAIVNTMAAKFVSDDNNARPAITFHRETNALIISGEDAVMTQIKNLVAKLDIRRANILVEAIVVELSDTAAQSLGVETVFAGGNQSDTPIGLTRFSNGNGPDLLALSSSAAESGNNPTLSAIATNSLLASQGLVAGIGSFETNGDAFGAIINAIAKDKNSNILSTPSVIAMDNEEANLIIGQEIPITTGESLGSNNANPFRTTSRQEVGIKLTVKPQINEGDSVILEIKQEVSGVAGPLSSSTDLITNKRSIETKVLVDNNQIIVLGGLIDEDIQVSVSKVPVLGSIPMLGRLFSSKQESVVQRNLMVFIKPKILLDGSQASEVSLEKYNFIDAQRLMNQKASQVIDLRN
ncbi:MAG: type II secretion system protein GspD, partial [Proteobacteria bacterium]|nr:type II secretion system protein GspD [Pseudomonadota bacterium]